METMIIIGFVVLFWCAIAFMTISLCRISSEADKAAEKIFMDMQKKGELK